MNPLVQVRLRQLQYAPCPTKNKTMRQSTMLMHRLAQLPRWNLLRVLLASMALLVFIRHVNVVFSSSGQLYGNDRGSLPTTNWMREDHTTSNDRTLIEFSHNDRVTWNWTLRSGSSRGLVAQYTDVGEYEVLFNASTVANQAYAKYYGYDFLQVFGHVIQYAHEKGSGTYNKPYILERAMAAKTRNSRHPRYDFVFLLDADVVIQDFSRNVCELVDTNAVVVGHRVDRNDPPNTNNINIGITVWNLRHAKTKPIIRKWKRSIGSQILQQRVGLKNLVANDQRPLQELLKKYRKQNITTSLTSQDFVGGFVAHVMRPYTKTEKGNLPSFSHPHIAERLATIQTIVDKVCRDYAPICQCSNNCKNNSSNHC